MLFKWQRSVANYSPAFHNPRIHFNMTQMETINWRQTKQRATLVSQCRGKRTSWYLICDHSFMALPFRGVRFLRSRKAAPDCRASIKLSITPVSSPSARDYTGRSLHGDQQRCHGATMRKKKQKYNITTNVIGNLKSREQVAARGWFLL